MLRLGALAVLVVGCAACFGGSTTAPRDGVLRGQVYVVLTGGGLPSAGLTGDRPRSRPQRFRLTVRGLRASRRIIRVVRTDARGSFRLHLPPGRYEVSGPLRSRASARVLTGKTASVFLSAYISVTLAV
jgi:hypothetical protein